jgi:protein associated with RNAse G/E
LVKLLGLLRTQRIKAIKGNWNKCKGGEEMKELDILVYKYNNKLHYEWQTILIKENDNYVLVKGEIGRKLKHYTKGKVFNCPLKSLEFFSLTEGFTVNIDISNSGDIEYYCNICLPSKFNLEEKNLSFIDLDLDLIIDNKGHLKVIDEDEFILNSESMSYPKDIIDLTYKNLENLKKKIRNNEFPFDGFFEKYIEEIK